MKLTGKCKIVFEKFYLKDIDIDECEFFNNDTILSIFYTEKESMQYGVYIDFFDEIKYEGKGFFSVVFERYYNDKTDDFNHNDIVSNSIEQCNKFYNEMLIEIDYKLNK